MYDNQWKEKGEDKAATKVWVVEQSHYLSTYSRVPINDIIGKKFVTDIDANRILGDNVDRYYGEVTVLNDDAIDKEVARAVAVFTNRRKGTKSTKYEIANYDYCKWHQWNKAVEEIRGKLECNGIKLTKSGLSEIPDPTNKPMGASNKNNLRKDVFHAFTKMMNKEYHTDYYGGIKIVGLHIKANQHKLFKMFKKLGYNVKKTDTYKQANKEEKAYLDQWVVDMNKTA